MLGADAWCAGVSSLSIQFAKGLFSTSLTLAKNSTCFGTKLYWGSNSVQKSFAQTGNAGLKKHWVVHMSLGEIENRWRQKTNQTTIKSFQIRLPLTHKTKKPHTSLLCLLSALFLFVLFLQWTNLQLFSCQHSSLKVKSRVDQGLVNLSAAAAVEREATCSEGREHLRRTRGSFFSHFGPMVVVSGTSSFETWPAWEDTEVRGAQLSLLLPYFFDKGRVLYNMVEVFGISQLHSRQPSFSSGVFDPDSMTPTSRTKLCFNPLVTVKLTIIAALRSKYLCRLCSTEVWFSELHDKLIGESL